jgi:hypothetical protein
MCACAVGDFCYEIKKPWNWFSFGSSVMRWLDAGRSCEEPSLWVWGQVVRLLWLSMVESRRSMCLSIAQVMIRFGHPKLARSEKAIARGSGRDGERQSVPFLILHLCRTSPFWLHYRSKPFVLQKEYYTNLDKITSFVESCNHNRYPHSCKNCMEELHENIFFLTSLWRIS